MTIPQGYTLVPTDLYEKFVRSLEWADIEEPTLAEISKYTGISDTKIFLDMKNINCPLRKTYEGKKGRGNPSRFNKHSVELYKQWLLDGKK